MTWAYTFAVIVAAAELAAPRSRWLTVAWTTAFALSTIVLVLTPVVMMPGPMPEQEAALCFTVEVLIMPGAGWSLLDLVFSQRRPASA